VTFILLHTLHAGHFEFIVIDQVSKKVLHVDAFGRCMGDVLRLVVRVNNMMIKLDKDGMWCWQTSTINIQEDAESCGPICVLLIRSYMKLYKKTKGRGRIGAQSIIREAGLKDIAGSHANWRHNQHIIEGVRHEFDLHVYVE